MVESSRERRPRPASGTAGRSEVRQSHSVYRNPVTTPVIARRAATRQSHHEAPALHHTPVNTQVIAIVAWISIPPCGVSNLVRLQEVSGRVESGTETETRVRNSGSKRSAAISFRIPQSRHHPGHCEARSNAAISSRSPSPSPHPRQHPGYCDRCMDLDTPLWGEQLSTLTGSKW